jgi:hypothetical protein
MANKPTMMSLASPRYAVTSSPGLNGLGLSAPGQTKMQVQDSLNKQYAQQQALNKIGGTPMQAFPGSYIAQPQVFGAGVTDPNLTGFLATPNLYNNMHPGLMGGRTATNMFGSAGSGQVVNYNNTGATVGAMPGSYIGVPGQPAPGAPVKPQPLPAKAPGKFVAPVFSPAPIAAPKRR